MSEAAEGSQKPEGIGTSERNGFLLSPPDLGQMATNTSKGRESKTKKTLNEMICGFSYDQYTVSNYTKRQY